MKTILISTVAALGLIATPASAQLLGGGGSLGGAGSLSGGLGSTMNRTSTISRGTLDGAGSASGSRSVDRRSGRASASGSAAGSLGGTLGSTTDLSRRSIGGEAAGTASGSASGSANADLVGTDDVRGFVRTTASTARGTASTATGRVRDTAERARSATGFVSGTASGSASAMGSAASNLGNLALAGTSAAQAAGSFDLTPGMPVVNKDGRVIGTVDSIATDSRGRVRSVLVGVGERAARVPAANFTGSGNVLVSAMGKGDLKDMARAQENGGADPEAGTSPAGAERNTDAPAGRSTGPKSDKTRVSEK